MPEAVAGGRCLRWKGLQEPVKEPLCVTGPSQVSELINQGRALECIWGKEAAGPRFPLGKFTSHGLADMDVTQGHLTRLLPGVGCHRLGTF